MALEKTVSVDSVTVKASGHLEVRNVVAITEDGAVISSSYSRYVIDPGAPVPIDVEAYLRLMLLGETAPDSTPESIPTNALDTPR